MNQEIRSKLDRICNILWGGGLAVPTLFVEQISYLIYLKLLDEREAELEVKARLLKGKGNGKPLFPDQASRYRWSNWRFKSGKDLRDFVRDEVFPYMASLLKEEPQVAIYFQDAKLEIEDPHVLKEVIDGLDTFQFGKLGPDVKGDIFEYLLQYLSRQPQSDMGQFRTPRQIRMAMVEMVDPDLGDTICDLACGTAGFLVDCVEHILAKYSAEPREVPIYGEEWLADRGWTLAQARKDIPNLQTYRKGAGEKIPNWELLERSIFGFEVSRQMMRISMMNLVLHGIRNAHVKRANALSELGGMSDEDLRRRYKCVLMNPPFAGMLPAESIRKDLPTQSAQQAATSSCGKSCWRTMNYSPSFRSQRASSNPTRESRRAFWCFDGHKPFLPAARVGGGRERCAQNVSIDASGSTRSITTVTIQTKSRGAGGQRRLRGTRSPKCCASGGRSESPDSRSRPARRLGRCCHRERKRQSAGGPRSAPSPGTISTSGRDATSRRWRKRRRKRTLWNLSVGRSKWNRTSRRT
jgi:hypothetical protein